jgi:Ras-related protein Rab-2A
MSLINSGEIGKYDYSFKMIVIGDAGVGKSCLTNRAAKEKFLSDYSPTVGFEFLTFSTNIDNKIVKLQIWDTCGQEVYRSLITNFYRNASLAMMVYAINNRESFIHINQWLKEVRLQSHPDVKIILIGNKSDLDNERVVSTEEAKKFKEENQILYFEETSAKTGLNSKEVFTEAARILYNEHKNYKLRSKTETLANTIHKSDVPKKLSKEKKKRNKGCC